MKRSFIVLTIMMTSAFTYGASRVGGGTLSNDSDLYQMNLAPTFSTYELLPNEAVRLTGPIAFSSRSFGLPQLIQVYRFAESHAVVSSFDRAAVADFFVQQNAWQVLNHADPCVDIYKKKNSTAVTYVAAWGQKRGVTLVGQDTLLIESAIDQMLKSLQLWPGACLWK